MITTALQFSGGKDSLATLHWWRTNHGLHDTLVMWTNTGLAYPEVIECMERTRATVRHFLEIETDAAANIRANGYPSDVVPINNTPIGKAFCESATGPLIQPWVSCCSANLWQPMQDAVLSRGIKRVVRGQRIEETQKATIRNGYVDPETGIEYLMPIEDWSTAQVFAYLRENDIDVPAYYASEHTSRDCWACTAFLGNGGVERIRALPEQRRGVVLERLREIREAIAGDTVFLDACLVS